MAIIKTPEEIIKLKRSAAAAEVVFEYIIPNIVAGYREHVLASMMKRYAMDVPGVTDLAFPPIVASGSNGAQPHAEITERALEANDLVTIDFGVIRDGYASDITRTFMLGNATETQQKIYAAVLRAQLAGLNAARPGMSFAELDAVCRGSIENDGYGEYFVHTTGHGVGTEVHEEPRLGKESEGVLEPGMVVTIEPGIYIEGIGGVRIEDTVVITETGCENITPRISKNIALLKQSFNM